MHSTPFRRKGHINHRIRVELKLFSLPFLSRKGSRRRPPVPRGDWQAVKKEESPIQASFFWWGKVDSNHRSRRQQIYSLPHLTALEFPRMKFLELVDGLEPPAC